MGWPETLKNQLSTFTWPETDESMGISSVLIPIGRNAETNRIEILLTKRTTLVENHKGQVSFPGGFRETTDLDLLHTALREVQEEIGAGSGDIEVLGRLTPVQTHQKVLIYPWVGWMTFPYTFTLNAAEVERLLYLPVEQLLTEGLTPVSVNVGLVSVKSTGIEVDGEMVWGATARLLTELREQLLLLRL